MKICYYPGCTLKTQASELDRSARRCAAALDVEMEEIENWQCCGAVYPTAPDEVATRLSAVRALAYAKEHGGKLLTLCSACHNVIKRVNLDMKADGEIARKANAYLDLPETYRGETEVLHYLELLKSVVGFDEIKKRVKNPLKRKIGAYYGCLLLRPSDAMQFDAPENPTIVEDLIKALGGEVAIYAERNDCCGAYVGLKDEKLVRARSERILRSAKDKGATEIVTACPLCYYNLRKNGGGVIPVRYVTDLLSEALGVDDER